MQPDLVLLNSNGWKQSYLPIHTGLLPPATVTLSALADREIFARIVPSIASAFDADTRYASLTLLHYALGAVVNLLVAPLVLDRLTLTASAKQLGILVQENGTLTGIWAAADIPFQPEPNPARLGVFLAKILDPIVSAAQATIPLKGRGVRLVLHDAVYRNCQTIARAHNLTATDRWIRELLAGMGDTDEYNYKTVVVRPDEGPLVEMTIPRVCCVLAKRAGSNACPTCPKYSETERLHATTEWLCSMEDDDFRQVAGRPRVISTSGDAAK